MMYALCRAKKPLIGKAGVIQMAFSYAKRHSILKWKCICNRVPVSVLADTFALNRVELLKMLTKKSTIFPRHISPMAFDNLTCLSKSFTNQVANKEYDLHKLLFLSSNNQRNKSDSSKPPPSEPNPNYNDPSVGNMLLLSCFILAAIYLLGANGDPVPEITWSTFHREMLTKGEVQYVASIDDGWLWKYRLATSQSLQERARVEKLDVGPSGDIIYVHLYRGAIVGGKEVRSFGPHYSVRVSSAENFEEKMSNAYRELGISSEDFLPINYRVENELMGAFFGALSSVVIFGLLWYFFNRRSGGSTRNMLGENPFQDRVKAKATIIEAGGNNGIRLRDVGGMGEAKEEVLEFVDYLKSPNRYKRLGAKIPKGALLVGPPGTGKTLLAKAIATEAKVPFLSMAGPEFVELFSGVGSARVRDLFNQAKKRAPCIVYIDELDSVGRSRRSSGLSGGENEQENTLIQLLVEMDGMNSIDGVIMLSSTNRADILDKALLRPGRFDRLINVDLPTLSERKDIVKVHLSKLRLESNINKYVQRLAELTPGYSGADLANICNEAALHAARLNEKSVDTKNFDYAVERVIAGMEKRSHTMSSVEREMLAYHEAGHAVVGWMLQHVDPLLKVSIVPRTNATFGYSQYLPSDQKLYTTEQLFDRMCMALGGRVAESKIFHKITTGSEDDLKKVTDIAYKQITTYGMNKRVGYISLPIKKPNELGKKAYSDQLSKLIDEEARSLVSKCYRHTESLIDKHLDELKKVAKALLQHEVLNYEDLENLIGKRPYQDKRNFDSAETAT